MKLRYPCLKKLIFFSEGQRLPEFQVATPQLLGGVVPLATAAAAGFGRLPPAPIITDISPVVSCLI